MNGSASLSANQSRSTETQKHNGEALTALGYGVTSGSWDRARPAHAERSLDLIGTMDMWGRRHRGRFNPFPVKSGARLVLRSRPFVRHRTKRTVLVSFVHRCQASWIRPPKKH